MTSPALDAWQSRRSRHLDNLVTAHAALSGPGRGRRWRTESVNWSLTLRLAGEFQGFARDLHDNCIDALMPITANQAVNDIVRNNFTKKRQLDVGNAYSKNLYEDFFRLGVALWDALDQRYPAEKSMWAKTVDDLNSARNAVAHSDEAKLAAVKARGFNPGAITSFRKTRKSLNGLAVAMDDVLADYIATVLNTTRPW